MELKKYIFSLDYGNRVEEKEFIKDVLNNFDTDTLVGCGIFVNNNPYSLEFLFFASLEKDADKFDEFIKNKYNQKKRIFNYFLTDIYSAFAEKGYNVYTFIDADTVDIAITEEPNELFQWPSKKMFDNLWKNTKDRNISHTVFLSHSSKDEEMVNMIFDEFQKSEISAWYDKYEIEPGDSITDKINDGLEKSDVGIICISNNFLDSKTGWTKAELNYFVQRRMNHPEKPYIIVNFDVPHDELPPLVQDCKYINYKNEDAIDLLIGTIKKKLET